MPRRPGTDADEVCLSGGRGGAGAFALASEGSVVWEVPFSGSAFGLWGYYGLQGMNVKIFETIKRDTL